MADDKIDWPPLDTVYDDEFGTVDAAIYGVAGRQWPVARRFAQITLGDEADALRIMIKAAAIVSRRQIEIEGGLETPAAFLMLTFKRLVLGELKKRNRRREIEYERQREILPFVDDTAQTLDNKILIEQLWSRMDTWMKRAFELRLLDYSYEEMSKELGMKANVIRSKYSKELERLRKQIEEEKRQAEQRVQRQQSG